MAIQNFLSGGFYGKLGAVVGQRWKNIRTVRVYVIPADPKTPAQMAQRSRFRLEVFASQAALRINPRCTLFEAPDFTSWNYRMRTAKQLKNLYTKNLDLVPLAPTDKNPPFIIGSLDAVLNASTRELDITISGNVPAVGRAWGVMIVNDTQSDNFEEIVLLRGDSSDATPNVIHTSSVHDFDFNANTWIRVCTIDDVDSAVDMAMSQALLSQSSPKPTVAFDTTVTNVTVTAGTVKVRFVQPFEEGTSLASVSSYRAIQNFAYVDGVPQNPRLVDDEGFFALVFEQEAYSQYAEIAFGASCNIDLTGITVETSEHYLVAEQIVLPLAETEPIERLVEAEVSSVACEQDVLIITVGTAHSGEYWQAENKTWLSLNNGASQDEAWKFEKYQTAAQLSSNLFEMRAQGVVPDNATRLSYGVITLLAQSYDTPEMSCTWNGVTFKLNLGSIDCSLLQWEVDIAPAFTNVEATSHVFDFKTNAKKLQNFAYGTTAATANYSTNEKGISADMPESCSVGVEIVENNMAFYGVANGDRAAAKIGCFAKFDAVPCQVGNTIYNYQMPSAENYTNDISEVHVDVSSAAFKSSIKALLTRTNVEGWEQWEENFTLEIGYFKIERAGFGTWQTPEVEENEMAVMGTLENEDGDAVDIDAFGEIVAESSPLTFDFAWNSGAVPDENFGAMPWYINLSLNFTDSDASSGNEKIVNLVSGSDSVKYVCDLDSYFFYEDEATALLPTELTQWA